eukprot:2334546-Rhodomonas_salina.1
MSSGLAESTAGPRSVSCSHCLTLSTAVVYSDGSILVLGSHGDTETSLVLLELIKLLPLSGDVQLEALGLQLVTCMRFAADFARQRGLRRGTSSVASMASASSSATSTAASATPAGSASSATFQ